jgi:hypothetical protein
MLSSCQLKNDTEIPVACSLKIKKHLIAVGCFFVELIYPELIKSYVPAGLTQLPGPSDCNILYNPEVRSQFAEEVIIRHVEIAFVAPFIAPGIADDHPFL